jgi:hypothetical protein
MKSGFQRFVSFIAIALVIPASFGVAANKEADAKSTQAQLLDHAEYPCSGCFFGASEYYFCFKADNKIIIAREKIPTMNYMDPDKNYLTKAYKRWLPWQSSATVNLKYDDKYIWTPGPNGKDIRMKQDYSRDIFMDSRECRAAVKK